MTSTMPRASSSCSRAASACRAIAYEAEPGGGAVPPRDARPGPTPAIASTRSSARCIRTLVDAWELRTAERVIVAEVALDGLAAGRPSPSAPMACRASRRSSAISRSSSPRPLHAVVVESLVRGHAR